MADPNERLYDPAEDREAEEERIQPASEIVDPREGEPEPDAPDVKISGPREPDRA